MDRLAYMEGLRGIAALVVVVEHLMKQFYPAAYFDKFIAAPDLSRIAWLSLPPFNLLHNGAWAVSLFFVLSGYVLSLKYLDAQAPPFLSARTLCLEIVARYARLALPVVASLLVVWLALALNLNFAEAVWLANRDRIAYGYPSDLQLLELVYIGAVETILLGSWQYNPPLWTMQPEFFGSLLVFFGATALVWLQRLPLAGWLQVGAYLALLATFAQTHLFGFILGMGLCHLRAHENKLASFLQHARRLWLPIAIAAGLYLCGYSVRGLHEGHYAAITFGSFSPKNAYTYNTVGALLVLLACTYSARLQAALSFSLVQKLGRVSFSLYLTHYTVISTVAAGVYLLLGGVVGHTAQVCGAVFVSVPAMFAVAVMFDRLVNVPTLAIARKIKTFNRIAD